MTPEREAEIRAALSRPDADSHGGAVELLAELDALRGKVGKLQATLTVWHRLAAQDVPRTEHEITKDLGSEAALRHVITEAREIGLFEVSDE